MKPKKPRKVQISSKMPWRSFCKSITIKSLEDVNEALRMNKCERAVSKGSWKLVPKDSCDVYKERRKRKQEKSAKIHTKENKVTKRVKPKTVKKKKDGEQNHKRVRVQKRRRSKPYRMSPSDSSVYSSCYSTCSCVTNSATSASDMDYE